MHEAWLTPPKELHLNIGEIHLWRISLIDVLQQVEEFETSLSQEELEQAQKFYNQTSQVRFILGRGNIRVILGKYLHLDPKGIQYQYSQTGKPDLDSAVIESDIQFNYSQSEHIGLLGVIRTTCIGVDIERIHERIDYQSIAKRFYTSQEYNYLTYLPEDNQRIEFFRIWTAKEAYLKAIGVGLSRSLSRFNIELSQTSEFDSYIFFDNEGQRRWTIKWIYPYPGFMGAVAVPGKITQVKLFKLGELD